MEKENKRHFFSLLSAVMSAHRRDGEITTSDEGDERFGDLCDEIFQEDKETRGGLAWFTEKIQKIEDEKVREGARDAGENLARLYGYFYLMVGYALAQDYEILDSNTRKEIDYLRRRIKDAGMFPVLVEKNHAMIAI